MSPPTSTHTDDHGSKPLTQDDVDEAVAHAIRQERDRRSRRLSQVVGGLVVGFVCAPMVIMLGLGASSEFGVPTPMLLAGGLVVALLAIAYGWRLPPFR